MYKVLDYVRLHLITMFLLGTLGAACTTSTPRINVLGVKPPQAQSMTSTLKVFVEVVNPTSQALNVQRMEYRFQATSWLDHQGTVSVNRNIAAGAKAVLELVIPVGDSRPSHSDIPYRLQARLIAQIDKGERSWSVLSTGALAAHTTKIQVASKQ